MNAFWSLTMYDPDTYLVANADRYSLGDRDPVTFGPEGSLTLYLQSEPPGAGKEANWLPAPKEGEFKTSRYGSTCRKNRWPTAPGSHHRSHERRPSPSATQIARSALNTPWPDIPAPASRADRR